MPLTKRRHNMSNDLFSTGRDVPQPKLKGGDFIKIPPNEYIEVVPLTGLEGQISPTNGQHEFWDISPVVIFPCLGRDNDCPGCKMGNNTRQKHYLAVLLKGSDSSEQSILPYGSMLRKQLQSIENMIIEDGDETGLEGKVIRITRTGSGKKTRYAAIQRPTNVDVSDVKMENFIDRLGSTDPTEIWARLEKKEDDDDADDGWGDI